MRILKHLPIFSLLFFAISCAKLHEHPIDKESITSEVKEDNVVSLNDIIQFAALKSPITKSGMRADYSIDAYKGRDQDTLMYIVNYGNGDGWVIVSADNRTPPILAESDNGYFFLDEQNGGLMVWMDMLATNMARVISSEDDGLSFTKEEIALNRSFWTGKKSRGGGGILPPGFGTDEGFWQVSTTTETEIVDECEHMTPHWDQEEPYNQYCPLKNDGSGLRAPAGCVALAGSELLYYLHQKFGLPSQMVSSAYCYGDIDSYSRSFTNATSTVWATMDTLYNGPSASNLPEAVMIGFIGNLTGMNYRNEYSWTFPSRVRTEVLEPSGYSVSHDIYSESIVQTNLINRLPLFVTATNMLIPVDFDIHCFLIDGYKVTRTKYTHHYHWVPGAPIPINKGGDDHADYTTISYSDPIITSIKMNWGWRSQWYIPPANDGWYSLTAGWVVNNGGEYDYNYNIYLNYGFAPAL